MRAAIEEAKVAVAIGEVPIGAVAVENGELVCASHNMRECEQDPLGHAELLLLRNLSRAKKSWRLNDVEIYVTCEPCIMCAGAILQSRIPRLVYGCKDPKAGAVESLYSVLTDKRLNHRVEVVSGVLAEECSNLLKDFFKGRRELRTLD